jgi:hypothetical protein
VIRGVGEEGAGDSGLVWAVILPRVGCLAVGLKDAFEPGCFVVVEADLEVELP